MPLFEQICEMGPHYQQAGFSIRQFYNKANSFAPDHEVIEAVNRTIALLNINLDQFDRYNLLTIWRNPEVPINSKLLLTFWWGGLNHAYQAPGFYAHNNLDRILNNSENLMGSLGNLLNQNNQYLFIEQLGSLYNNLKNNEGTFHMNKIGTSFFTKILQFYFTANQPIGWNGITPIIADKWSMKAVFADMISTNYLYWNQVFSVPVLLPNNKSQLFFANNNNNEYNSYRLFIQYFNNRVLEMRNNYNDLTPFRLEEIAFGWGRDLHNAQNPRNIAENILRHRFGPAIL